MLHVNGLFTVTHRRTVEEQCTLVILKDVAQKSIFKFYLDVRSFVVLLFQEVTVFCARCPRRLTAVWSLRKDPPFLNNYYE